MELSSLADQRTALYLCVQQLSQLNSKAQLRLLDDLNSTHLNTQSCAWMQTLRAHHCTAACEHALEAVLAGRTLPAAQTIRRQLAWLSAQQVRLITWGDVRYPELLKQIAQPPLFYISKVRVVCWRPQIAMVGARKATPSGLKIAFELAKSLAEYGLVITSGLALGIDGACHQGALAVGAPTIAVLGTGLDVLYPKRHGELAQSIVEQGLIVSEFALGTPPARYNFPQRNRIISGLSAGTLVVEAGAKSGSLITAQFALEQSREVFAIPGALGNKMALGCHQLLKQGAHLVQSAEDVVEVLQFNGLLDLEPHSESAADAAAAQSFNQRLQPPKLKQKAQLVYACLADQGSNIQELLLLSGLDHSELLSELTQLQRNKLVEQRMGLYFKQWPDRPIAKWFCIDLQVL